MKSLFNKTVVGGFLGILFVVLLFIFASYVATKYEDSITLLVSDNNTLSMVYYVIFTAVAVVIAPISTLPLIPLASAMWGWFVVGLLSIAGWVLGSQIAFFLARRYGKSLVQKMVSFEKLERFEKSLPETNIFWTVVLLRMTVPVDVLSYAVGLFSKIKSSTYFLATLLGVIPFAFIFAYTGTLSLGTQFIIVVEVAALILTIYLFKNKKI